MTNTSLGYRHYFIEEIESDMDLLQNQVTDLALKVDSMHQIIEHLNHQNI